MVAIRVLKEPVELVFPDPEAPPYRTFSSDPTSFFVDKVAEHIKETGQPETCPGLYRGRLSPSTRYRIIRPVDVDRKKRPDGNLAPCPMCTHNRFLSGALVYCFELKVVAVIGHCCADHADIAEEQFKTSELKRNEESYLLTALPQLQRKRNALAGLRGVANDAQTVFRKFRSKAPELQQHLREVVKHGRGRLLLYEVLRSAEEEDGGEQPDYFGPAGFRGRGDNAADSRDHDFGLLAGITATLKDYKPASELTDAIRNADSFVFEGDEAAALELIVEIDNDPKRRAAAVAICQAVDRLYEKFAGRLSDFAAFWADDNIDRLRRYGASPFNLKPFEIALEERKGATLVVIRRNHEETRVVLPPSLLSVRLPEWKSFEYGKRSTPQI